MACVSLSSIQLISPPGVSYEYWADSQDKYTASTLSQSYDDSIGCKVTDVVLDPASVKYLQELSFQHWPDDDVPNAEHRQQLDNLVARTADFRASNPGAVTYINW